jgi:uncharacterized protein YjiS (DUF1127 family)
MRDYALFHAERLDRARPFPVLRRLISNWRRRRRLYDLQHLDDHALDDIGLTRADVAAVLGQPLSVDPVWDLERRARLRRTPSLPDATARWLHDSAFTHPRLDRPR